MKHSTQELKEIINNAPEGSSGIIQVKGEIYYTKLDGNYLLEYLDSHNSWIKSWDFKDVDSVRSLSDIKEIIELRERLGK